MGTRWLHFKLGLHLGILPCCCFRVSSVFLRVATCCARGRGPGTSRHRRSCQGHDAYDTMCTKPLVHECDASVPCQGCHRCQCRWWTKYHSAVSGDPHTASGLTLSLATLCPFDRTSQFGSVVRRIGRPYPAPLPLPTAMPRMMAIFSVLSPVLAPHLHPLTAHKRGA
ncbi:hypothetical protein OG21DRAFT_318414 [Imleria badia]|nr:hypothetical protein OG21DRAFT_318414 [Imleria badia]